MYQSHKYCETIKKEKGLNYSFECPQHISESASTIFWQTAGSHAHNNSKSKFPPRLCVCGRKRFNDFCLRPSILWNNPYSYLSWLGILLSLCNSLHPILLLHFQCFGGAGRAAEGRENGCYSQKHEAQQHQNETTKTVPSNNKARKHSQVYCEGLVSWEHIIIAMI